MAGIALFRISAHFGEKHTLLVVSRAMLTLGMQLSLSMHISMKEMSGRHGMCSVCGM